MAGISLQQFVQAIIDLCRLSAGTSDSGLVLDLSEEASAGIRVWMSASDAQRRTEAVDRWAAQVVQRLEYVSAQDVSEEALLRLRVRLLRLRALASQEARHTKPAQPVQKKKTTKTDGIELNTSQKKVFDIMRTVPEIRTSELAARLRGRVSERTIKRSLKELVAYGLLGRTKYPDGSVSYRRLD